MTRDRIRIEFVFCQIYRTSLKWALFKCKTSVLYVGFRLEKRNKCWRPPRCAWYAEQTLRSEGTWEGINNITMFQLDLDFSLIIVSAYYEWKYLLYNSSTSIALWFKHCGSIAHKAVISESYLNLSASSSVFFYFLLFFCMYVFHFPSFSNWLRLLYTS